MGAIEEYHQKEIEYQDDKTREIILCFEKELAWYINNILRKEEWTDVKWIDCRVIICEICVELLCESVGQDFSKVDGTYLSLVDPPVIILKQMFSPSLFLHEGYHHYQFLKNKDIYEKASARPRAYRDMEREARQATKGLYAKYGENLKQHILEKCNIEWGVRKMMKRKRIRL